MFPSSSLTSCMYAPGDSACPTTDQLEGHPKNELSDLQNSEKLPQDGGLIAWLTAFGAFLIQFTGFGFTNAFGVFQDYYSQHYLTNVSSSTISWIGSVNAFLVFSGGLLFGRLHDKGYFRWLVIGGCSLQILCLFMLSLTKPDQFYQVFLCHGLGLGLATSMSYAPSLAVLSRHFEKKRSIVMAMVTSGTPIGAAVYTILLNNLLNGRLGFANSIRITAAANTVLLLISYVLMRTRSFCPKTQVHYLEILRTSSALYICASVGLFFLGAGSFFPMFYIQLDSSMHGLGKEFSFYTIVILNGSSFIGRVTAGFIAAYCGILNTTIGSTLSSSVVIFAMITVSTRAGLASIGVFFGYFAGVYVALSSPLIAFLTPDLSDLGARLGISLFMTGLGSLIGTPSAGALLGPNYVWWRPAVFCGCVSVASTIMFAITHLILRHRRGVVSVAP